MDSQVQEPICLFLSCADRWKNLFFEKFFTALVHVQNDQCVMVIILRYVCWRTPPPPWAPSQTPFRHSKEADSGAYGGGGLENGLPRAPRT